MDNIFQTADARNQTLNSRLKIGFENVKKNWPQAKAVFTDNTLQICGHPVMERWEDNYMKLLADIATLNGGDVLEVGFGMGISANYIQQKTITNHIIIEANKDVYTKALEFANQSKHPVKVILGFWEEVIDDLPDASLSGILFDTYPLVPDEVHSNHFKFFEHAQRLLVPGGILTYYSDEMKEFSQQHINCLKKAGFEKISGKLCTVNPPLNCNYWQSKTIIAPIIIK